MGVPEAEEESSLSSDTPLNTTATDIHNKLITFLSEQQKHGGVVGIDDPTPTKSKAKIKKVEGGDRNNGD